jgi:hypothetical protein
MKAVRLALTVAVAVGTLAPAAGASILCRTPTRAVVQREVCRPRETQIPLVDTGPSGVEGSPGPAGANGHGAASVFDATGALVGPVFYQREDRGGAYGPGGASAFAVIDDAAVGGVAALGVTTDGRGAGRIYYTDAACSGTPFIVGVQLLPELQIVKDTVFFPVTPAPVTMVRAYESADVDLTPCAVTPRGGCCVVENNPHTVPAGIFAVAQRTTLQALGFQAPFSARAE